MTCDNQARVTELHYNHVPINKQATLFNLLTHSVNTVTHSMLA